MFFFASVSFPLPHSAQAYGNEAEVGAGIKDSGVPREEIFLTTKIDNMEHKDVPKVVDESLKRLGTDYVDLILMHWPVSIGEHPRLLCVLGAP